MAKKKVQTEEQKFEEILESIDAGKNVPEATGGYLDSNRALKLKIIDQIEKINNKYYLLIIKKYVDNLGV